MGASGKRGRDGVQTTKTKARDRWLKLLTTMTTRTRERCGADDEDGDEEDGDDGGELELKSELMGVRWR